MNSALKTSFTKPFRSALIHCDLGTTNPFLGEFKTSFDKKLKKLFLVSALDHLGQSYIYLVCS